MTSYRTRFPTPLAVERTMKRAGDIVLTSRAAVVVPGRKGQFKGRWS